MTMLTQWPEVAEVRGHHFLTKNLSPSSLVVDLGACGGTFSTAVQRRFDCHCVAVEANPDLYATIQTSDKLTKLHCAIAKRSGAIQLQRSQNPEGSSIVAVRSGLALDSVEVRALTLADLLERIGCTRVNLLKVDIEGAEFSTLLEAPLAVLHCIDQISVEFHDFMTTTFSRRDVRQVRRRLKKAGFLSVRYSVPFGNTDILFVRLDRFELGPVGRPLLLLDPYLRAAARLRRRLHPSTLVRLPGR